MLLAITLFKVYKRKIFGGRFKSQRLCNLLLYKIAKWTSMKLGRVWEAGIVRSEYRSLPKSLDVRN